MTKMEFVQWVESGRIADPTSASPPNMVPARRPDVLRLRACAVIGAALALCGCASPAPEPDTAPACYTRKAVVQTIPRSGWIELNGGYVGVTPAVIEVKTRSDGVPIHAAIVRATDMASGAWEQKVFAVSPLPEKILFDLRSLISPSASLVR